MTTTIIRTRQKQCTDINKLATMIEAWEGEVREHERKTGKMIEEDWKILAITDMLTPDLRTYYDNHNHHRHSRHAFFALHKIYCKYLRYL